MAIEYNFKYMPLVGKLSGKSMAEQTETAINEIAKIVNDNTAQAEIINTLAEEANANSVEALEKATEALDTSSRVYIKETGAVDLDSYCESQLIYINNVFSQNLPVAHKGFLEVKTNDDKTQATQVFTDDVDKKFYIRTGTITAQQVGDVTNYIASYGDWEEIINNTYLEEYVQEELRQHGSLPVGYEYFSFNPNIPQGCLPLFGGEYDRATYSDLWAWVQTQTGYLKTEAQWQALSTTNAGNVPYYSDGDGSTTFRVPSLKCWIKAANGTVSEVGSYLQAGLPNITGSLQTGGIPCNSGTADGWSGAIYQKTNPTYNLTTIASGNNGAGYFTLDASKANSIYGNSTTVQPPSIVGMWLVKAYGVVEETGTIDEQQYIDDRFAAAKDYTDMEVETGVPTGCVQAFAGQNTPTGWLLCDGSAVNRVTYAKLFSVIGTSYGSGDGSTTFNVPNLIDRFVQGNATAGTVKSAGLPNITGYVDGRLGAGSTTTPGAFGLNNPQTVTCSQTSGSSYNGMSFDASRSNSIYGNSTTVQPPALTMRYIIKY